MALWPLSELISSINGKRALRTELTGRFVEILRKENIRITAGNTSDVMIPSEIGVLRDFTHLTFGVHTENTHNFKVYFQWFGASNMSHPFVWPYEVITVSNLNRGATIPPEPVISPHLRVRIENQSSSDQLYLRMMLFGVR